MANWALYCKDAAFGRTAATEVTCSKNAAYAANVVDGDPSSIWRPEDTAASVFVFGASESVIVKAVALCNHSMSGETITLREAASLTTTLGTVRGGPWTIPDNNDTVFIIASPTETSSYWQVEFSGAETTDYVGEISLLDNSYHFALDYPAAPRYPLGIGATPGAAVLRSSSGVPFEQTMGGTGESLEIAVPIIDMAADTPGVGRKIVNWYREGGSHRLWVTDDTFGSATSTIGRGYYCYLPQISAPITAPGARGELGLPLEVIPYDRQA